MLLTPLRLVLVLTNQSFMVLSSLVRRHDRNLAFFQEFLQGAKSIVMQISFVMLIFLLFSDQISGEQKSRGGGKLPQGASPLWKKARNNMTKGFFSANCFIEVHIVNMITESKFNWWSSHKLCIMLSCCNFH